MARPTLMVFPTDDRTRNNWSFEHAMAHRSLMAVMGPLTQWSIMPYWVDPQNFQAGAADKWNLNHQQAHDDYNSFLPAYSTAPSAGIPQAQILVDHNFQNQDNTSWWTFANHQQHLIAGSAIHPLPAAATPATPWWATPPRRVSRFW
jgi:hypothetical protein